MRCFIDNLIKDSGREKELTAEKFHMGSVADPEFNATSCHLDRVRQLLENQNPKSEVSKLFKLLKETKGITCDNHLPWKEAFHRGGLGYIDGIRPEDLDQPVMWEIDPWERAFVAIKHTCDKVNQGAIAFFQTEKDKFDVVSGGHFSINNCMREYLEEGMVWLKDLLQDGSVLLKHPYVGEKTLALA